MCSGICVPWCMCVLLQFSWSMCPGATARGLSVAGSFGTSAQGRVLRNMFPCTRDVRAGVDVPWCVG